MADLQDELRTTAEVGDLDPSPSAPATGPLPLDRREAPPGVPATAGAGLQDEAGLADEAPSLPPEGDPLSGALADSLQRARALLDAHPVADGCNGLATALRRLHFYDLELGESAVDTDLPRLRDGRVGALFCSLHLPEGVTGDQAVGATLELLDVVRRVIGEHPEGLRAARDASEAADARHCGRVAVLLGPAGAAAIGDSLGVLRSLHALGLRVLTLTGTSWAGDAGLTRFGEEVVREMNRLGVLADLSGASDATARRALAVSRAPVLCTRSAARALRPHPANLPDDVLAALGAAGGLCMVPLTAEQTGPAVRDVADHLDHVRRLAGPECVGLSGTYDTGAAHPRGLADCSRYPRLVAELLDRGWSPADLALLTWGNVQRVLRGADFAGRAARTRRGPSTLRPADLDGARPGGG
ncbi:dipeptidase [Streptomyces sp. NPDC008313]|uniref:dipeptidase n=1 Tax=Streptomyces sp. NPDC008313 TaxID=3364826 RepID=UPI0036E1FF72